MKTASAAAALLLLLVSGCWRTPLTEPKEALLYYDSEGNPKHPGVVIRAPKYMERLREIREMRGITEVDTYRLKPNLRLHVEVVGVEGLDRHVDVSPNALVRVGCWSRRGTDEMVDPLEPALQAVEA